MKEEKIIFLGFANNIEEFYSIFGKKSSQEILMVCEDVWLYKNIVTITEKEIKEHFGDYKNIAELREKAIKYFADNIQGKHVDIGKYKNIRISRNARDRYKKYSAYEKKLIVVIKLIEILKNAKYKDSSTRYKERKDRITMFHYFTNEVIIKNEKYKTYITIAEDENGNLFYDLDEYKNS